MKPIDKQYIETPFYGVIQMTQYLRELDHGRRAYHIPVFVAKHGNNPPEQGLGNGYITCVPVAMATIFFSLLLTFITEKLLAGRYRTQ